MVVTGLLNLEKCAKSKGGDKYSGKLSDEDNEEILSIYIPQYLSRKGLSTAQKRFTIVISDRTECYEGSKVDKSLGTGVRVLCALKKTAKSQGGDRYDGVLEKDPIVIYIPQCFTRSLTAKPIKCKWITFYPMDTMPIKAPSDTSSLSASSPISASTRKRSELLSPTSTSNITFGDEVIKKPRIHDENSEVFVHDLVGDDEHYTLNEYRKPLCEAPSFTAYSCKDDDDIIIKEISDADGNFDMQNYFRRKIAREEELLDKDRSNLITVPVIAADW